MPPIEFETISSCSRFFDSTASVSVVVSPTTDVVCSLVPQEEEAVPARLLLPARISSTSLLSWRSSLSLLAFRSSSNRRSGLAGWLACSVACSLDDRRAVELALHTHFFLGNSHTSGAPRLVGSTACSSSNNDNNNSSRLLLLLSSSLLLLSPSSRNRCSCSRWLWW